MAGVLKFYPREKYHEGVLGLKLILSLGFFFNLLRFFNKQKSQNSSNFSIHIKKFQNPFPRKIIGYAPEKYPGFFAGGGLIHNILEGGFWIMIFFLNFHFFTLVNWFLKKYGGCSQRQFKLHSNNTFWVSILPVNHHNG